MKRAVILFSIMFAAAFAANAANAKTVGVNDIEERDGVFFEVDTNEPFTGRAVTSYVSSQLRFESFYKDGLKDGKETSWYEDGSIKRESEYKDGERHGEWIQFNASREPTFHRRYDNGDRLY